MENVQLLRSVFIDSRPVQGEVVWVSLDEKNIHVFSEDEGKTFIFKSSFVTNMVSGIDQIEDGQPVSLTVDYMGEVLSALFVYPEIKTYNLTISASL